MPIESWTVPVAIGLFSSVLCRLLSKLYEVRTGDVTHLLAAQLLAAHRAASAIAAMSRVAAFSPHPGGRARIFEIHLCSRIVAFDVGNRLWDGRRPQDGHMMEMSYRCCCAAAGMVFLPHSTRLHPSCVPACSPASSSTKFDMLPLTVCALCALDRHDRCQCCRHVGTASAACSANVPRRTTLWRATSLHSG